MPLTKQPFVQLLSTVSACDVWIVGRRRRSLKPDQGGEGKLVP